MLEVPVCSLSGPPRNLEVLGVSGSALQVTWEEPDVLPQYYIVMCLDPYLDAVTEETLAVLEGLPQPCTSYEVVVCSVYEDMSTYSAHSSGYTSLGGES